MLHGIATSLCLLPRCDALPWHGALQVDSPEFAGASGALEAVQTRLYSDEVGSVPRVAARVALCRHAGVGHCPGRLGYACSPQLPRRNGLLQGAPGLNSFKCCARVSSGRPAACPSYRAGSAVPCPPPRAGVEDEEAVRAAAEGDGRLLLTGRVPVGCTGPLFHRWAGCCRLPGSGCWPTPGKMPAAPPSCSAHTAQRTIRPRAGRRCCPHSRQQRLPALRAHREHNAHDGLPRMLPGAAAQLCHALPALPDLEPLARLAHSCGAGAHRPGLGLPGCGAGGLRLCQGPGRRHSPRRVCHQPEQVGTASAACGAARRSQAAASARSAVRLRSRPQRGQRSWRVSCSVSDVALLLALQRV